MRRQPYAYPEKLCDLKDDTLYGSSLSLELHRNKENRVTAEELNYLGNRSPFLPCQSRHRDGRHLSVGAAAYNDFRMVLQAGRKEGVQQRNKLWSLLREYLWLQLFSQQFCCG